jgi:hypothetical protein
MEHEQLWLWPAEYLGVDPRRPRIVLVCSHKRALPDWGRSKTPARRKPRRHHQNRYGR